ncbi:MAG: hypothetical protein JNK12_20420 [Acidimicrobiales bacterium]|nr:hypothetical protein [Acidimicrobiales bacterium]
MAKPDGSDRTVRALHVWTLVVPLALVVGAVGCSENDSAPAVDREASRETPTSTAPNSVLTTTTSSAPPTTERSLEDEIIARYVGFWDARFAANSGTPNPDDPRLREFATGDQLDAVVAETQTNLDSGLVFRRSTNPAEIQRVTVVEVSGRRAIVQECVVSDGVIVRRDSGEIVNDQVSTHNVRGEMQRVRGQWRVASAELVQRWEGVAGCAHDS